MRNRGLFVMVKRLSHRGRIILAVVAAGAVGAGATAGVMAYAAGTPTLVKGRQLGALAWYSNNHATGAGPSSIVFDGTSIWTANVSGNSVTKINTSTGAGTNYALPTGATAPSGIAFDGTYIWTSNQNTDNVTRINTSTGAGTNYALPTGADGPSGTPSTAPASGRPTGNPRT
jgi:streptogramin lyase